MAQGPSRHDRTKKIDALIAVLLGLDRQMRAPAAPREAEYQMLVLDGSERGGWHRR